MIRTKIIHTSPTGNADDKVNRFLDALAKEHPLTTLMGITHQTVVDKMENRVIDSVLIVYNTREDEEEMPMPEPIIPDPKQF